MPREESQMWKSQVHMAVNLDLHHFYCLPDTAEEVEEEGAGKGSLGYRMLHQGVAPVYRFPLLSASGGSASAGALAAPPESGQYSAGS